jgi:hypothetical protein
MSLFILVQTGNLKMSYVCWWCKTVTNGVRDTPQHWTVGMWFIDVLDDDIRRCAEFKSVRGWRRLMTSLQWRVGVMSCTRALTRLICWWYWMLWVDCNMHVVLVEQCIDQWSQVRVSGKMRSLCCDVVQYYRGDSGWDAPGTGVMRFEQNDTSGIR